MENTFYGEISILMALLDKIRGNITFKCNSVKID